MGKRMVKVLDFVLEVRSGFVYVKKRSVGYIVVIQKWGFVWGYFLSLNGDQWVVIYIEVSLG